MALSQGPPFYVESCQVCITSFLFLFFAFQCVCIGRLVHRLRQLHSLIGKIGRLIQGHSLILLFGFSRRTRNQEIKSKTPLSLQDGLFIPVPPSNATVTSSTPAYFDKTDRNTSGHDASFPAFTRRPFWSSTTYRNHFHPMSNPMYSLYNLIGLAPFFYRIV